MQECKCPEYLEKIRYEMQSPEAVVTVDPMDVDVDQKRKVGRRSSEDDTGRDSVFRLRSSTTD